MLIVPRKPGLTMKACSVNLAVVVTPVPVMPSGKVTVLSVSSSCSGGCGAPGGSCGGLERACVGS